METTNKRLLSVDILRGLTIIFMIIVNDPGSWSHVYAPLLHAEWNGVTPTDYIFPTFLFIVGVSIVLSLSSKVRNQNSKKPILKKIFWRSLKIYLVGLFLWLWPNFDFDNIRWAGVLQRISFVYLFVRGTCVVHIYLCVRGAHIPSNECEGIIKSCMHASCNNVCVRADSLIIYRCVRAVRGSFGYL